MPIAFTSQSGATRRAIEAAIKIYERAIEDAPPCAVFCAGNDGSQDAALYRRGFDMLVAAQALAEPLVAIRANPAASDHLPRVALVDSGYTPGHRSRADLINDLEIELLRLFPN